MLLENLKTLIASEFLKTLIALGEFKNINCPLENLETLIASEFF